MVINRAEREQSSQNEEWYHRVQSVPMTVSLLPMAVATNQPPIIRPRIRAGATLETSDSPIGLSISSPSEMTQYAEMSHRGETLFWVARNSPFASESKFPCASRRKVWSPPVLAAM